jgi:hypothetical protein
MHTVIVANHQDTWEGDGKKASEAGLRRYLQAQVEVHKALSFPLVVLTNLKDYQDGYSQVLPIFKPNTICPTGSKMFAAVEFLSAMRSDALYWFHDLDVWPCWDWAKQPPIFATEIALCRYRKSYNGGSVFYRKEAAPLCQDVVNAILSSRSHREEPVMNAVWGRDHPQITVLNSTYNVGCSGFDGRLERAEKPIRAVHFHPDKRGQWDRFQTLLPDVVRDAMTRSFGR